MNNKPVSSFRRNAFRKRSKTTNAPVVPIDRPTAPDPQKPRLIAHDPTTRRYILGIGRDRLAFDITTCVTRLKPETGDAPAAVLPMSKVKGKKER